MKLRTFAVLGFVTLATFGCRTDPTTISLLERQLRLQEDEIYRLRAQLDNYEDDARIVEERPAGTSRSHSDEPDRRSSHGKSPANDTELPPVNVELPGKPATSIPKDLKGAGGGALPPDIPDVPPELQGPSKSPNSDMNPGPEPSSDGPSIEMGPTGRAHITMAVTAPADAGVAFDPKGDSQHVASVVLNRSLTGGINDSDGAGDQGLLVVVEPKDSRGRPLTAPAKVVVALLDPALIDEEGNALRLALWEFTPEETAAMFRRVGSSEGMHLAMAWPNEPPRHEKLHLFVRYVTSDGRMLEANQPIEVMVQRDRTARGNPPDAQALVEPREADPPPEESMRPLPAPERPADRVPHTASRDSDPRRPVWSPERR